MEFLKGTTKLLSENLLKKAIALNRNLRLQRELNLHVLLWSKLADFHGSDIVWNLTF